MACCHNFVDADGDPVLCVFNETTQQWDCTNINGGGVQYPLTIPDGGGVDADEVCEAFACRTPTAVVPGQSVLFGWGPAGCATFTQPKDRFRYVYGDPNVHKYNGAVLGSGTTADPYQIPIWFRREAYENRVTDWGATNENWRSVARCDGWLKTVEWSADTGPVGGDETWRVLLDGVPLEDPDGAIIDVSVPAGATSVTATQITVLDLTVNTGGSYVRDGIWMEEGQVLTVERTSTTASGGSTSITIQVQQECAHTEYLTPPEGFPALPPPAAKPAGCDDSGPAGNEVYDTDFAGLTVTNLAADWELYASVGNAGNGWRTVDQLSVEPSGAATSGDLLVLTAETAPPGTTALVWNGVADVLQDVSGDVVSGGMKLVTKPITYGHVTVRMRVDDDPSETTSPVLILWPDPSNAVPHNIGPIGGGEIDFAEGYANRATRTPAESHIHHNFTGGGPDQVTSITHPGVDMSDWHVYEVDWSPAGITVAVDGGTPVGVVGPAETPSWPMHLTAQLDAWDNGPMASPVRMEIDYVNVVEY